MLCGTQAADQVEFWRSPEKSGWMHSQGEVIKTWRRRWFVLKQGFLFRFADQNVKVGLIPLRSTSPRVRNNCVRAFLYCV